MQSSLRNVLESISIWVLFFIAFELQWALSNMPQPGRHLSLSVFIQAVTALTDITRLGGALPHICLKCSRYQCRPFRLHLRLKRAKNNGGWVWTSHCRWAVHKMRSHRKLYGDCTETLPSRGRQAWGGGSLTVGDENVYGNWLQMSRVLSSKEQFYPIV